MRARGVMPLQLQVRGMACATGLTEHYIAIVIGETESGGLSSVGIESNWTASIMKGWWHSGATRVPKARSQLFYRVQQYV